MRRTPANVTRALDWQITSGSWLGEAGMLVTQVRWSLGVITYFLLSVAESGHHTDMTCKKGEQGIREVGVLQASTQDSRSGEMPFFVTELHTDCLHSMCSTCLGTSYYKLTYESEV